MIDRADPGSTGRDKGPMDGKDRNLAVTYRPLTNLIPYARKRIEFAPDTLERKRASMAKAGLARGAATAPVPGVAMPPEVNGRFPPEGGLPVERAGTPEVEEELA